MVASQYGLSKHVKDDSAKYLKSWLESLHEEPDFLKTVIGNVRRCSTLLTQRIEAISAEMAKGEKADYSQFRSEAAATKEVENEQQAETAREAGQEERHFGRSR